MCLPIPPIPHIVVPFTLTVSLKSGWGFRHRTETEGVKVPFATITTIPNIQTALFIQPTAIGTVYEDLGGNHEYQLRLTQPNAREASSSCTISLISDVTLPTRLSLLPSATSINLSNITSFVRPVIPLSAEHGHGPSRSLSGLWVNPFSRWVVRLYCHNQLCVPTC